jgi:hypothetical protein
MKDHSKKQSRRGKMLGGVLIGAVLSIGAVAGSASADTNPVPARGGSEVSSASVKMSVRGYTMSARSGIRW